MNCADIQDRLSEYYDGEMPRELHVEFSRHLAECEQCASQLTGFESITRILNQVPPPALPPTIWDDLAAKSTSVAASFSVDRASSSDLSRAQTKTSRWPSSGVLLTTASILLLVASAFWIVRQYRGPVDHSAEFVATMDQYMRQLPNDPVGAEQLLIERYGGQTVDADGATKLVGYRPIIAEGLPAGYSLLSTSVLQMPCCTCVKALCRREDGSTFVLFEHDDDETQWFGDRPMNMQMCANKECCLVDLDSSIAATWRQGSRSVTAIGARDVQEITMLVSWLSSKLGNG